MKTMGNWRVHICKCTREGLEVIPYRKKSHSKVGRKKKKKKKKKKKDMENTKKSRGRKNQNKANTKPITYATTINK